MVLDKKTAKTIIMQLGSTGTPPEYGVEFFTAGIDFYLRAIEEEYLESYIPTGRSAFRLVIGDYGGGKTHFLYMVRDIAWKHNYAVSYISLSPGECPFNKLELVYKAVMSNLMYPMTQEELMKPYERGIDAFVRRWFTIKNEELHDKDALLAELNALHGIESSSFQNAVKYAFIALMDNLPDYDKIIQWLKGEEIDRATRDKYGITEHVDKTTAFRLLRSLAQWIRAIGYTGLVLLFDEAERGVSIATSREREQALDNLRQIIDECGNSRLPSTMIFYAIPDEK